MLGALAAANPDVPCGERLPGAQPALAGMADGVEQWQCVATADATAFTPDGPLEARSTPRLLAGMGGTVQGVPVTLLDVEDPRIVFRVGPLWQKPGAVPLWLGGLLALLGIAGLALGVRVLGAQDRASEVP
jgi:hypothetical protein